MKYINLAKAAILAGLSLSPAFAAPLPALSNLIYGVTSGNKVVEVNVEKQSSREVYDLVPELGAGNSNAFAFDTARKEFLFVGPDKGLYSLQGQDLHAAANPQQLGLISQPLNASYWGNAYWYFIDGSNTLVKVIFTYDTDNDPNFSSKQVYTLTGLPPNASMYFGDIAISKDGMLYGVTAKPGGLTTAYFFKVDLALLNDNTGTGTATILKGDGTSTTNPITATQMQIAFSWDYTTLYGQNAKTGTWYTLETNSGDATPIPSNVTPGSDFTIEFDPLATNKGLRDLGGSAPSANSDIIPPVAVNDNYTTLINTPFSASVASNDTIPYDGSSFDMTSNPSNGTVTSFNSVTGEFTYIPNTSFTGTDSFTYKLCLPSPFETTCSTATVTITIAACDFNTLTQGGWPNKAHDARLKSLFSFEHPVVIGDSDPAKFNYTFTGAKHVQNFLPSSGIPSIIFASEENPTKVKNTLAGQLLTLTLNVRANDNLGLAHFETGMLPSDMASYFSAHGIVTVSDLIARANLVFGSGNLAVTSKAELSLLTKALEAVTLSWHEGVESSTSVLACGQ